MKKLFSVFLLAISFNFAFAESNPLWMRYPAISPDGETIAFAYKGDIFTVPAKGGRSQQLTTNAAYDSKPIWSPSGEKIAFVSNRFGGMDILLIGKDGGAAKRVTTHSGTETPIVFKDENTILFSSNVMPAAESTQFPSAFSQVYEVSIAGGRPKMFSSLPMENISFSPDGKKVLYHDYKGYEDPWRKHHTSSIARDIWECELGSSAMDGKFTKLTDFKGEDRNPIFQPNGNGFFYLSEDDGTFNVYKSENGKKTQLTEFKDNPVRFLSMAKDGELCFGYDGEIYTLNSGSKPSKVKVEIVTDVLEPEVMKSVFSSGAGQIAVSNDGKQIAFIYRGDVYVTSSEYKTTKRITNTAVQERNVDFAPDGRSLVYSSDRNGVWQVYMASIVEKDEKTFPYATDIKEENITNTDKTSFQPAFSPDGKEVAYLEDRTAIRIINLKSKEIRTVMESSLQYSYTDGDQWFQWSPDSKWILSDCIFNGGWNNKDVALIDVSGNGVIHNLTKSGYNDSGAKWVLDGKAMIWGSDRAGYRSHGSWGAESDVFIMFFDLEAYEKFMMNKEDLALLKEEEENNKTKREKKAEEKAEEAEEKGEEPKTPKKEDLKLDIENAEYRVLRLTSHSSKMGDAVLNKDGSKLFYLTRFEGGMDLWVRDLKDQSVKILTKGAGWGNLIMDSKGTDLYMPAFSGIKKINMNSGAVKNIAYEGTFEHKLRGEREYIFDHIWRQVDDKFYVPEIHGIDWDNYKTTYAKFLPHITNVIDFSEMLSEMLGELNGSHTGARASVAGSRFPTAALGVFYDESYSGDGLKIKEIIKRSPLAEFDNEVKVGDIITAIDDEKILAGMDYFPLLEGKAGKKVRLTITDGKKEYEVEMRPISYGAQSNLLYERWVENNRKMVEETSGGKIGYVHIRGMNSESFRVLYKEALGRNRDKEALVVDTRNNGGGWLHDDIVTFLSGKQYQRFMPRGQYIGSDPYNKWNKPSAMLMCENNYSNAHGTPWLYKELGIGKLVGTPVPGTMTAVWWERQIDPRIVFGIPQVGCMDNDGNYLENKDLDPDILIYNTPEEVMSGGDSQLEAATKHLMK